MPAVSLATTALTSTDVGKAVTLTALTAESNADYITVAAPDQRISIMIVNADTTHAASVVFSAGDGVCAKAVTVAVAAATTVFIPMVQLETAKVLNMGGTNKGKIIVNTTIASGGDITKVSFGVVQRA